MPPSSFKSLLQPPSSFTGRRRPWAKTRPTATRVWSRWPSSVVRCSLAPRDLLAMARSKRSVSAGLRWAAP
eukprot:8561575-Alexandrium_andersonii.AAC.1